MSGETTSFLRQGRYRERRILLSNVKSSGMLLDQDVGDARDLVVQPRTLREQRPCWYRATQAKEPTNVSRLRTAPPAVLIDTLRITDHLPPVGGGRWNADAEEWQRRLGHDGERDKQGRVDDDRRHHVRQDVDQHDPPRSGAERPRSLDVLLLLDRH